MKTVAFQGERGAFSEDAAFRFWHYPIVPSPQKTFRDVFQAVTEGQCDYGIVPIENSQTGSIHQNMDLFLEFNLSVIGEVILRIHHCLLALPGIKLPQIKRILSHPQALEQCTKFLETLKNVEIVPMHDTAGSARWIAEKNLRDSAAIASLRAGKDYGLHILAKNIEDNSQNYTRFLVIARDPLPQAHNAKTSIIFSTKDIPGALFKALSVFALRDINLLKIESRPLRKGPWKYWFYLDFEGSINDPPCARALEHLSEITTFLKVLGSYPAGKPMD